MGKFLRKVAGIFRVFSLVGCGSVFTIPRSDESIKADAIEHWRTKCTFIPRVYSGVGYDVCKYFYAEPRTARPSQSGRADKTVHWGDGRGVIFFIAADLVLSATVDTVALPYTIYLQSTDGSIKVQNSYPDVPPPLLNPVP